MRTTTPAEFVTAVTDLVQPAERMAVLGSAVLEGGSDQPHQVEISGLSDRLDTEMTDFAGLRLGDPALAAEQKRILARMRPIVVTTHQVRAGMEAEGHGGLRAAVNTLITQLGGLQSAG